MGTQGWHDEDDDTEDDDGGGGRCEEEVDGCSDESSAGCYGCSGCKKAGGSAAGYENGEALCHHIHMFRCPCLQLLLHPHH